MIDKITIFNGNVFSDEMINEIKNNDEIWSFPLEELSYLLEEHKGESFILIGDRLYEFNY